jgi:hypothetical protein
VEGLKGGDDETAIYSPHFVPAGPPLSRPPGPKSRNTSRISIMSSYIPPTVSPVLQQTVDLKIEEFARSISNFRLRYDADSPVMAKSEDTLKRLTALLDQIKKHDPYLEDGDDLDTMTRYIEQAKDDQSISQTKLQRFEKQLLTKLDLHYHRQDVSTLHISLLKEALEARKSITSVSASVDRTALEDEFDMVEGELETAFERFEQNTFKPDQVDAEKLENYLSSFFENDASKRGLERFRNDIEDYGKDIIEGRDEVDEDTVEWGIKNLLQNSLLSDDKRNTLQGYLESPVSIRELTSLINVKSIRNWNWRNPEKGLPVTARQNTEGKYCITIEEDIVDMLFLHSLAVGWGMMFKDLASELMGDGGVFVRNELLTPEEYAKRDYYLLSPRPKLRQPMPPRHTHCTVCHGPPPPPPFRGPSGMPPPPPPPPPPHVIYHGARSRSHSRERIISKPKKGNYRRGSVPPPPPPGMNLNEERYRNYSREFFLSRLPKRYNSLPETTPVNETQAALIKHLATEARLRDALHVDGNDAASGLTANFKSFASSLPHKTILTMLKFIGVPQIWLDFFTRFLEAPLNMGPVVRGTSDQVLTRTCGLPVAHGMELFLGEVVLFFFDFAAHQKSGGYLYRLRDKCYFVGKPEQVTAVEIALEELSSVSHLSISIHGCSYEQSWQAIGSSFVNFAIYEKPLAFSIDQNKVEAYARRVKKQLATCTSVLDWIRVWNSSMGKYAPHLFGPLANVFGKPHLEVVTRAYNKMHKIVFESSNLTAHVTGLLQAHADPSVIIPFEPLIFLPTAYGGLGVKNPYTTLNLARDMLADPTTPFTTFLSDEKTYYEKAKEVFNAWTVETRTNKLEELSSTEKESLNALFATRDRGDFMTFEEYTSTRERIQYPFLANKSFPPSFEIISPPPNLLRAYASLLEEPRDHIQNNDRVAEEVSQLARDDNKNMKRWYQMSGEDQMYVQMYGDECFEQYGGLEIWCGESVPAEVIGLFRGEEDGEDDGSSVGSWDD